MKRMSPVVRITCGILGFSGVAAVAFNAYAEGGAEIDLTMLSMLLGGFLFLYAAFFGALPLGSTGTREDDRGKMSKSKWQMFWIAALVFMVIATSFLSEKGVFRDANLVVLGIVGLVFVLVAVALYFYIKDRHEDVG